MEIPDILKKLTGLPHRGATTKEEQQAAEILRQQLAELNIDATIERFKAITSYSWEVIFISLTMIAGLLVSPFLSKIGTAIVLLGFWNYVRHFTGRTTIFTPLIPKKQSQNVIAQIPSAAVTNKNVLLMAHYDSARASAVFAPERVKNFRQSFLLNTCAGIVSIIWAYLGEYWGASLWFKLTCLALSVVHLVNISIHLHRETCHQFVPGANDNASGVAAVLAVVEKLRRQPLQNSKLWVAFTGCEEAGIQGARAFFKKHWTELPTESTAIINIDNVGSGNLHYVTGEGMLLFYNFDEALINQCQLLAQSPPFENVRPLEYRRAYFDTLVFVQHGYPCTTLIALDNDQLIPHWHWYTDTVENIDEKTIRQTADFAAELIRRLDGN